MGKNTEEIKTKKGLYKVLIDNDFPPEKLDDDINLYVTCFFLDKDGIENEVDGGGAKNIKEAAALVQKLINEGNPSPNIAVREAALKLFGLVKDGDTWKEAKIRLRPWRSTEKINFKIS